MKLWEFQVELFSSESVPTEAVAYRLLSEAPLASHINYLAAPWSVLINQKLNWRRCDLRLNGGFTICQHIRYREIIPVCLRIGLDTLFTPHVELDYQNAEPLLLRWTKQLPGLRKRLRSKADAIRNFQVKPFPHFAVNGTGPSAKDLWYSFVGANTHWTREVIFRLTPRPDSLIQRRENWHFYGSKAQQDQDKSEYQSILARSRYSLCPRGTGASTVRFWESLQAGAIPVLISDAMSLPDGCDWNRCTIRVAESQVARVDEILQSIPPIEEKRMRRNCLAAYEQFSGKNFVSCIRSHYESRRAAA